jgi:hypothetical protein
MESMTKTRRGALAGVAAGKGRSPWRAEFWQTVEPSGASSREGPLISGRSAHTSTDMAKGAAGGEGARAPVSHGTHARTKSFPFLSFVKCVVFVMFVVFVTFESSTHAISRTLRRGLRPFRCTGRVLPPSTCLRRHECAIETTFQHQTFACCPAVPLCGCLLLHGPRLRFSGVRHTTDWCLH